MRAWQFIIQRTFPGIREELPVSMMLVGKHGMKVRYIKRQPPLKGLGVVGERCSDPCIQRFIAMGTFSKGDKKCR
jgi:hypothetical protein